MSWVLCGSVGIDARSFSVSISSVAEEQLIGGGMEVELAKKVLRKECLKILLGVILGVAVYTAVKGALK